jgi:ribosomal protein L7/L12
MMAPVTERAAALWEAGERWDAILSALRTEGYSKVDCIKATIEQLRLPLTDAKRVVHESAAWADVRQDDDEWHERLAADTEAALAGHDGAPA